MKLFAARVNAYKRNSKKIQEFLTDSLEGISIYVKQHLVPVEVMINWGVITFVTRELIMVIAKLSIPPGQIVTTDGDEEQLTPEFLNFTVHIHIPVDIMCSDQDTIVKWLLSHETNEQKEFREHLKGIFSNDFQCEPEEDFDLAALTDNQRKALLIAQDIDDDETSRH